jgi:hypothetical protein
VKPGGAWVLTQPGAHPLTIPTDATNADQLFDVFAALEGLQTERMLAHLEEKPQERVTVWQSTRLVH